MPASTIAPTLVVQNDQQETPKKVLTPEQARNAAELKARKDKKTASRKQKAVEKDKRELTLERLADEKRKTAEARRLEKEFLKRTSTPEELKRQAEEAELFANDIAKAPVIIKKAPHVKKSSLSSNRLGIGVR